MTKSFLIIKNRALILINQFLYGNEIDKKNKKRLWLSISLISFAFFIIFALSFLFENILINFVFYKLVKLNIIQIQWVQTFLFFLLSGLIFNGILSSVYYILHNDDIEILLNSPISPFEFIIAKNYEKKFINSILLFLIIVLPLFINIYLVANIDLVTLFFIILLIAVMILFTQTIRLLIIGILVELKLKKQKMITYHIISAVFSLLNLYSLIYILYPVIDFMQNEKISNIFNFIMDKTTAIWSNLIYYLPLPHIIFVECFNNFHHKNYFLSFLQLGLLLIILSLSLIIVLKFYNKFKKNNYFSLYNEYAQPVKQTQLIKFLYIIEGIFSKFDLHIQAILVKDFRNFARDQKYRWFTIITFITLSFTTMALVLYFSDGANNIVKKFDLDILIMLFGCNLVIYSLIDRFSIDSEGNNYPILFLSPINIKKIVWAKIIGMLVFAFPITTIFSLILFFLFDGNIWILLFQNVIVLPVLSVISIASGITFPNFEHKSILQIPSTQAKILINILTTIYIVFMGIIYSLVNLLLIKLGILLVVNIIIFIFFFRISCIKANKGDFINYQSIENM